MNAISSRTVKGSVNPPKKAAQWAAFFRAKRILSKSAPIVGAAEGRGGVPRLIALLLIHFFLDISYQANQKILTPTARFCGSGCILNFLKCRRAVFDRVFNHSIGDISAMTRFFASVHFQMPPFYPIPVLCVCA